jgi:hypothetical protein
MLQGGNNVKILLKPFEPFAYVMNSFGAAITKELPRCRQVGHRRRLKAHEPRRCGINGNWIVPDDQHAARLRYSLNRAIALYHEETDVLKYICKNPMLRPEVSTVL